MNAGSAAAMPRGIGRSARRHERRNHFTGARGECEQPGTLFKLPARQHFKQFGGMGVIAAQGFSHLARVLDVNDVHHDSFGLRAKLRDFDSCVTTSLRPTPEAVTREQIESVRNPDGALAERIDTGENNIRRLAREFLARRGHALTAQPTATAVSLHEPAEVTP